MFTHLLNFLYNQGQPRDSSDTWDATWSSEDSWVVVDASEANQAANDDNNINLNHGHGGRQSSSDVGSTDMDLDKPLPNLPGTLPLTRTNTRTSTVSDREDAESKRLQSQRAPSSRSSTSSTLVAPSDENGTANASVDVVFDGPGEADAALIMRAFGTSSIDPTSIPLALPDDGCEETDLEKPSPSSLPPPPLSTQTTHGKDKAAITDSSVRTGVSEVIAAAVLQNLESWEKRREQQRRKDALEEQALRQMRARRQGRTQTPALGTKAMKTTGRPSEVMDVGSGMKTGSWSSLSVAPGLL
ncbi:hypothetical protein BKA81DRAFT_376745 [Phyllosticta paracitricarpa]